MLLISKNVFINARHGFSWVDTGNFLFDSFSEKTIFQQCRPSKIDNFPFTRLSKSEAQS